MPFKRDRSPYYYIWKRTLPGYGSSGRLSSRVTSKKIARDMERLLEELAQKALVDAAWTDLLDAVCKDRTIDLPTLLKAKNKGELRRLRQSLCDPVLSVAIEDFKTGNRVTRQTQRGLDMLEEYAGKEIGPDARLGDLSTKSITLMCRRAESDGLKRNSVRRMLLRAISLMLRFHLGNAERNRIFAEVRFSAEDDTREVHLSPAEIRGLLNACSASGYDELAVIIRVALQTSADRGVLLAGQSADKTCRGLLVRDIRIDKDNRDGSYSGKIQLYDSKTEKRDRAVPITDSLCRELLVLAKTKGPDDPIFDMEYQQLDYPWKQVREVAKLEHVRFKDLRAQVSIYGEEAGIPQTVLMKTMGHSDEAMTRRYQKRAAAMSSGQAEAIQNAMFPGDPETQERKTA